MVHLAQTVHYLTSTLTPSPNRPNDIPPDPRHLGVPSGASKTISEPMEHLAQTVHLSYINTNTISKRTERDSIWPTSSGASKTISEPKVRLVQTCTYLTSTLTPSPNRPNKIPQDPCHLVVASGASKTISEPMVRLAKLCTYLTPTLTPSPNGLNKIPHDPHHLGVPSGASKMISEPIVRLAQTMHISYINTNTISKRTERDSTWPMSPRSSTGASKTIS